MVDLNYAYANARVKAMKSKLFDRDVIRELMDVRSLPEVVEMLEEGPYKKAFVKASTRYSGIELVKHALDDDLKATFHTVYKFAPAKARPLLSLLLKQWEVNNLKKIIAAKALGRNLALSDLLIVEGEDSKLVEKVIPQPDFEAIAKTLAHSAYGPCLRKAFDEYGKTKDFRVMLSSLDEQYFAMLSKQVMQGKLDAKTRDFLAKKLEYSQAMAVLRMLHSGMKKEQVSRFLQASSPGRPRMFLRKMVEAESERAALEALAAERRVDGKAVLAAKDLPGVEVELERALLIYARKTLSASVLSLGALVGYLYLKQEEVHSLRKIAYATQFEVKQEIRETVLAAV